MKYAGSEASDPGSTFPAQKECYMRCTGVQTKGKDEQPFVSKVKPDGRGGNPYWILEMTVEEGAYKGRKLWHTLTFIPSGKPGHGMALRAIEAFGYDPEGEIDIEPYHLYDLVVKVDVVVRDAQEGENGKMYKAKNEIANWHTPPKADLIKPQPRPGESAPEGGTDFEPEKLEAVPPAPKPAPAPQTAPARKPLWGKK